MKSLVDGARVLVLVALAVAIGLGTFIGYRLFIDSRPSVDNDELVRAQVIRATLFARNDLRVSRLSGTVQGVSRASRFWGWLPSSQVIKAPFTVDYFVDLNELRPADIAMSKDGRHFLIQAPDVRPDQPNIDMAKTSLNDVSGWFVTRGAYGEMATKVVASSQQAASARALSADNLTHARDFAKNDIQRLFEGALQAAKVDADVEVRFASDPRLQDDRRWDVSRSIAEVLADPRLQASK